MLLAIDVGNTHVVSGLYQGETLVQHWRFQSDAQRTVDEYALELLGMLNVESVKPQDISQVILSCVVPVLTRVFTKLSQKYISRTPLIVGPGVKTKMSLSVDDPRSVGADRIVNAVAAKELFGTPVIVLDFGTATTFDVVGCSGEYEGGLISPGLVISSRALSENAAMLPSIELRQPEGLIGKNTHDSMLSGVVYGYVALVDGVVARIKSELGASTPVVATGGLASLVSLETEAIDHVVPDLTLTGLRIIAELNK